jgi:uncharacterized membrane protein YidH (DUF202 family)
MSMGASEIVSQSAYIGMHSGMKNMFVMSSIAMAMIGYSSFLTLPEHVMIIKGIAIVLFIFAAYMGIKSANDFQHLLDRTDLEDHFNKASWRTWIYVSYAYVAILAVVIFLFTLFSFRTRS